MPLAPPALLAARLDRIRAAAGEGGLDALLVTHLPNLFYLTNFRASAGAAILTGDRLYFVTDFRYSSAFEELLASASGPQGVTAVPAKSTLQGILEILGRLRPHRLGIEAAHLSVSEYRRLERALSEMASAGAGSDLVLTERIVEDARVIKDPYEQGTLRTAARLLSGLFPRVLAFVRSDRTERQIAADVDRLLADAGFERPAFATIVASGPNSAFPHTRPSERRPEPGDPVLLDFGGVYDGYCVDLTRTVCLGSPRPELRRLHPAVLEAQEAAIAAIRPGTGAEAVDGAAREALGRSGLAGFFTHGTGHGLGIELHEAPRITSEASEQASHEVLAPAMVFTIEPGVYVPGIGGVRIEDDVLVTAAGCERLTDAPRELLHL